MATQFQSRVQSSPELSAPSSHPETNGPNERGLPDQEQTTKTRNEGRIWYLPHFGVYHPRKPDQIRVVFDSSAEFQGVSLNKELLPGPDLMNSLVGVLIRFRQENVAAMCDIEQMFTRFTWLQSIRTFFDSSGTKTTIH